MKTSNLLFKICLFVSSLFQVACSYTNIKGCRVPRLEIPGEILFGLFHQGRPIMTDVFFPDEIEDPFLRSVALGEIEAVKCLLKKGEGSNSSAAFRLSMQYGGLKVFKLLIEHYKDANLKDEKGNTPLHYALGVGLYKTLIPVDFDSGVEDGDQITKILLKNGADPNIKNNNGLTPFEIAGKRKEHKKIFQLLKVSIEKQSLNSQTSE